MIVKIKNSKFLQGFGWIVIICCFWELSTKLGWMNNYLLPPFSSVLKELFTQIQKGTFIIQVSNSFAMIIFGFSISLILAIVIIVASNYSKIFRSLIDTICTILTPLPGVAIMPIIIMFFGVSEKSMVVLMVHSVLWPIVVNILGGFSSVPKIYTEFAENIELSRWRIAKDIYMYSLMPHILAGVKVGWGRAWRTLISTEMAFGMIGEMGGIGYFIYTNRAYGNMNRVMVGVLAVIILGLLIETLLFGLLEKVTIKKWGM